MAAVLTEAVGAPRVAGVAAGSGAPVQANDMIMTAVGHFKDT
jgi:hypothetical protein